MQLDVRVPVGLMLAAMGGLLVGYGLLGDRAIYARSLGINVNVVWGSVLLAVAAVLLLLARRRSSSDYGPMTRIGAETRGGAQATATAFAALFSVVGLALYGLPLYYDFMVREFGWSRTMVTSGNAISKLVIGPLFGFVAGWIVDRVRAATADDGRHPDGRRRAGRSRRLTSAVWTFYVFYFFNALGYVCGGPLPCQVLCRAGSTRRAARRWASRISASASAAPSCRCSPRWLTARFGWRASLQTLGVLIVADRAADGLLRARETAGTRDAAIAAARHAQDRAGRLALRDSSRRPRSICSRSAACARSPPSAAPISI